MKSGRRLLLFFLRPFDAFLDLTCRLTYPTSAFPPVHALSLTCHSRKTRCSGKYPCTGCSRLGLDCKYTASYRRGRLPSIEIDPDHQSFATQEGSNNELSYPGHSSEIDVAALSPREYPPRPTSMDRETVHEQKVFRGDSAHSSRNSPEPAQLDRQGHYVGPASGVSFLLRIQRKLSQQQSSTSSDSSIFTFGDLPLPQFDPRFLILPPKQEAESLVRRYFEFASATHRFLHRQTLEKWLHELYSTNGTMTNQSSARSQTALLLMVFAHAETFPNTKTGIADPSSRHEMQTRQFEPQANSSKCSTLLRRRGPARS